MEDEMLMQAVGRGDRAAFATLFDRHHQSVHRFTYRMTQSVARAEELTQDVFLQLYRTAESYKPTAKFKTYLFRLASNAALNANRGQKRTGELSEQAWEAIPSEDSPAATLEGRQLSETLAKALEAMPARERAAFVMCRFEGQSYVDIATALDTSESAVKSLVFRATRQIALATKAATEEAA